MYADNILFLVYLILVDSHWLADSQESLLMVGLTEWRSQVPLKCSWWGVEWWSKGPFKCWWWKVDWVTVRSPTLQKWNCHYNWLFVIADSDQWSKPIKSGRRVRNCYLPAQSIWVHIHIPYCQSPVTVFFLLCTEVLMAGGWMMVKSPVLSADGEGLTDSQKSHWSAHGGGSRSYM